MAMASRTSGEEAAMTERQLVDCMIEVVAYAEMRAVLLAWAGIRDWDPN
jgi:hypothetical protein